ncbi:MAG: VWA domain-containing protein, partial [Planctomycetota bacterium]
PAFLLLILLTVGVWVGPLRTRQVAQGLCRSALVVLLAVGLARPVLVEADTAPTRVWVLDRSASTERTDADAAPVWLERSVAGSEAGTDVLVRIGEPIPDELVSRFDRVVDLPEDGPEGATPLAAALVHAAVEIPGGSRGCVTVLSDGLSTRGDDGRALEMLLSRGIPLHVATLAPRQSDVRPVDLRWRGELRVGATARLRVVVAGTGGAGRVVLSDATGPLAEASFDAVSERLVVPVEFEPRTAGYTPVRLSVECDGDTDLLDNEMGFTLPIHDPRRLLYVGDRQGGGAAALAGLIGDGFEVQQAPRDDLPALLERVRESDLVVLDDVPADRVPEQVQQAITEAVADEGLGLVMSGGRSSFGAGGWHETVVESVLPVELVQKEEKRDPSTTLVVVIDTSGSMSGARVQLAKETARLAIRRLMPHDKVGIVEFYGAKRWAAPIQPASNRIEIERALNRLDAGGGTVILPAIEEAFYGLQNVDTRYKHVLVLTDGGVEAGPFESLLRRMSDEGINVTTVLTGGGVHSEFLVNLANWGKGRFYSVPNRFNLPEVIFKQPSSAKLPSYRQGAHAVRARGGRGWWGSVDPTNVPPLAGYVETRSRPGAEVLLETVEGAHPVVSTWRWGLGRVTTIGTEPVGAGTGTWREWGEYGRALARLLERTAADGRMPIRFSV